ncbi:discoidin domain-containing protein [Acidipila sp. EB88]|uniref:glycosyl hydrolase 2 galactose-binding domain-containing protein n=1 Tax=Acidipila sp. EB88 TaxID=2305226 RepID=UPI0013157DA2|nr:discoidin domain-containing protein [Acidipila sp. EB88]
MATTRRDFVKSTILAGASIALPTAAVPARAEMLPASPGLPPGAMAGAESGFTRGIGLYPGAPAENFSPALVPDTATYRNLALRRPAYHSSSYDYNLTAQLVTDGIKDTQMPTWVAVSVNGVGMLPRQDREVFFDHFPINVLPIEGARAVVQIELGGGAAAPTVDRLAVFVVVPEHMASMPMRFVVSTSEDGRAYAEAGRSDAGAPVAPDNYPPDLRRGAKLFFPSIALKQPSQSRFYQVECLVEGATAETRGISWRMGQIEFYQGAERVEVGGPYQFTSAWMSEGMGEEWVYVDLGTRSEFDRVALHWIARAAEGSLQISDDAENWRTLQPLPVGTDASDDIRLAQPAQGRYVRVLMTRPASAVGYILSEFEVYGRGGYTVRPKAAQTFADGKLNLAGGAWRVERDSLVSAGGEALSKPGFQDDTWLVATVPGTVLTSYLNAGAITNPDYGKDQLYISDSYFYADFWYRTEFAAPQTTAGEITWLNFDGINWKADVFLNGEKIGRLEGGFTRGQFDVTGKLHAGKPNALAVRVEKNHTPGSCKQKTYEVCSKNGGALGADNPTYHASIGWDWISTIRGRNTGIWSDVGLSVTGPVTLHNPMVTTTKLAKDGSEAELAVAVEVVNHSRKAVTGTLRGKFGEIAFEQKVPLAAGARHTVVLTPATTPGLRVSKPELWWPVGYGAPHLYDVSMEFELGGKPSHRKAFKAGIRQMTSSEDNDILKLFINGRRFVARGGNWGFGESMLRYRAREYDAAVRYHREMNFTMVRNWVGQIGDDAFYEACDRHGVVVWQDFWLANPFDGPIPDNNELFLANARDFILRIRSHASIGLYCGRNEGFPPPALEAGIRKLLGELQPDIHYIGSSADVVVSGHGPYRALPYSTYFEIVDERLHSEIGMPNIPTYESVQAMMPQQSVWPKALDWGIHDYCLEGAMAGRSFNGIVDDGYGGAHSGEEWINLAQFVNYEGYRAMFEAQSKYRMGVLLWMSHPCWPSFVWQTYDYYLEPTAAYFGCRKASEPLHIQWNRTTEQIEVVNYSGGNAMGLTAAAELVNLDGKSMWLKTAQLDSAEDSTERPITITNVAGLSSLHFLRLSLKRGNEVVSTNFYLRSNAEGNYRAIRQLPKVQVKATTNAVQQGDTWMLTTELENTSAQPALMVRLKAVREASGDRILPAFYSDNYVSLMPGERQTISTELHHADTRGEKPKIMVGGFNVLPV